MLECEISEVHIAYTKKVNMKSQFKKMCTKQVPLKVSVLLGYGTVSLSFLRLLATVWFAQQVDNAGLLCWDLNPLLASACF